MASLSMEDSNSAAFAANSRCYKQAVSTGHLAGALAIFRTLVSTDTRDLGIFKNKKQFPEPHNLLPNPFRRTLSAVFAAEHHTSLR